MKTLIFNGSPRKKGDTVSLINKVIENLNGEYKIINAYDCDINPCVDCRYCWNNSGCCINDEMQEVYTYIKECDNIFSHNTNDKPAIEDETALSGVKSIAMFFNE